MTADLYTQNDVELLLTRLLQVQLEARHPEHYMQQISSTFPWTVDYRNRKHTYVLSSVAITLTSTDIGSINIPPGVWYLCDFPDSLRVFAANQATPIYIYVKCSDELLIPGAVALVVDGSGIGANVNISQVGGNSVTTNLPTSSSSDYPLNAVPITATSGNQANAVATATLAAAVGKTTYITGFEVTGTGAASVLVVTVTVTNTVTGTLSYTYVFVAGATTANQSLIVEFTKPIPASAPNTTIVVSCPASGTGGTNNVTNAHGYQL